MQLYAKFVYVYGSFLGRGPSFCSWFQRRLFPPPKMKNPNCGGTNHSAQSPIDPGEGQVLSSLSLTPEQVIKVICFLIPTKRDQQLFPFPLSDSPLNRTSWWSENFEPDILLRKKKKKILETREEREQKSKMGVVGGTQQWEENAAGKSILPALWPCRGLGPEPHLSWVSRPPVPRRCGAVCVPCGREAGCGGEQEGPRAGTAAGARAAGGAGAWGGAAATLRSAAV